MPPDSPAMRAATRLLALHYGYSPEQIQCTPDIRRQADEWASVIAEEMEVNYATAA